MDDHEPDREAHGIGERQDSVHVVICSNQLGPGQVDSNGMGHGQQDRPYPAAKVGRHIPARTLVLEL